MYQFFAAVGLGLLVSLPCWAYPIDVTLEPEAADISVDTLYQGNMSVVILTSQEPVDLQCQAVFINGPERPTPKRFTLKANQEMALTQFFRRAINRIRVTVSCER